MALVTYNDLKTAVADWVDRTDSAFIAKVPDFISLAETRLMRKLRVRFLTALAQYNVIDTTQVDFALPENFRSVRNVVINLNPVRTLRYVTPEDMSQKNMINDRAGQPDNYTIMANRLRIPTCVNGQVVEMLYYFAPQRLSVSNQENEFTENCMDALLYSALLEAKPYVKDQAKIKQWMDFLTVAIDDIETEDKNFRWGNTPLQMSADYGDFSGGVSTG